jgi:hypothetical protein
MGGGTSCLEPMEVTMLMGLIIGAFGGATITALLISALLLAKRSDRDYEDDSGVDWEDGRSAGTDPRSHPRVPKA